MTNFYKKKMDFRGVNSFIEIKIVSFPVKNPYTMTAFFMK